MVIQVQAKHLIFPLLDRSAFFLRYKHPFRCTSSCPSKTEVLIFLSITCLPGGSETNTDTMSQGYPCWPVYIHLTSSNTTTNGNGLVKWTGTTQGRIQDLRVGGFQIFNSQEKCMKFIIFLNLWEKRVKFSFFLLSFFGEGGFPGGPGNPLDTPLKKIKCMHEIFRHKQ